MKKTIFSLISLFTAVIMSINAYANPLGTADCVQGGYAAYPIESEPLGMYSLTDKAGVLTDEQNVKALDILEDAVQSVNYNIGVVITDNIGEDKSDDVAERLADEYYDSYFGVGTDGVLFMINDDTKADVISTSGRCIELYTSARLNEIFDMTDTALMGGDYVGAVEVFCSYAKYSMTESDSKVQERENFQLYDPDNVIDSTDRDALLSKMKKTADNLGYNIGAAIVSDVGSDKSDSAVEKYADELYEEYFGAYTDGILLLINNDTNYDYLSTSGSCIGHFSSSRIDGLFDAITPIIVDKDYYAAITGLCSYCDNLGTAESSYEERYYYDYDADYIFDIVFALLIAGVISAIAFAISVNVIKSSYALKPQRGAKDYIWRSSLKFSEKSDAFSHDYITRTHVGSSSSGGGHRSGGHSHGGGSHHRSGGSRHGGGGRHR